MADTLFSDAIMNLTAEEEAWLRQQLEDVYVFKNGETYSDDEVPEGYEKDDAPWQGYRFFADKQDEDAQSFSYEWIKKDNNTDLAIYSWKDGTDDLDMVGKFVSSFLATFRPREIWILQWADVAPKPYRDAFGGGCMFVRSDGHDFVSSSYIATAPVNEICDRIASARQAKVKPEVA